MYTIHTENEKDKQAANAIEEEQLSRSGGECQISSSHIFILLLWLLLFCLGGWNGPAKKEREEMKSEGWQSRKRMIRRSGVKRAEVMGRGFA